MLISNPLKKLQKIIPEKLEGWESKNAEFDADLVPFEEVTKELPWKMLEGQEKLLHIVLIDEKAHLSCSFADTFL